MTERNKCYVSTDKSHYNFRIRYVHVSALHISRLIAGNGHAKIDVYHFQGKHAHTHTHTLPDRKSLRPHLPFLKYQTLQPHM